MKESIHLVWEFDVDAETLYDHWLSSEGHSEMTGGEADCSAVDGEPFFAWNGYIVGRNLELKPHYLIVQSWRTSEFDNEEEDSLLRIELSEKEGKTELRLTHTNIPEGQTQYKKGWIDFYLKPMQQYFNN